MAAALLVLLWGLIYWPTWETPTCRVSATVEVVSPERGKPVFIAILAGNREVGRRSADAGQAVALDIPGMHISEWSLMVGWSDGSQSSFGALSSCPGEMVSSSNDGKAKILLRQR
jgi:hypothetical protein